MSAGYRLAGVHIGLLVLSLPLIVLWFTGGVNSPDPWAYVAIAAVYAGLLVTGKPKAFYKGLSRLRVGGKVSRILLGSAALLTVSAALDGVGGIGRAVGVMAIVTALVLFLWAIGVALFDRTADT